MASNNYKPTTLDDASSTYTASSSSTLSKEKKEANARWFSKNKTKESRADSKSKTDPASAALHNEAIATYMAFR